MTDFEPHPSYYEIPNNSEEFFKNIDLSSDFSTWIINKDFFKNNAIFYKTKRNIKVGYLIMYNDPSDDLDYLGLIISINEKEKKIKIEKIKPIQIHKRQLSDHYYTQFDYYDICAFGPLLFSDTKTIDYEDVCKIINVKQIEKRTSGVIGLFNEIDLSVVGI